LIAGNRLTSWQGYTLSYDSAGNLVHKQKTGFDQYLYWNSIGELDSARTATAAGTDTVRFGYDGFGRRVRKSVAGKYTLKFIYDGADILTVDSAGTRVRTFSYYPSVDAPHSMLTDNGAGTRTRYYFLQEMGAGSVRALIDSAGKTKSRYRYEPFGRLEDSLGLASPGSPYRFTGREYDAETQLYYYRARYYDQSISRFVSEDPIGLAGGINQYAYAGEDPVNGNDPSGLQCCFGGIPAERPIMTDGNGMHGSSFSYPCVVATQMWVQVYTQNGTGEYAGQSQPWAEPVFGTCGGGGGIGEVAGAGGGAGSDPIMTRDELRCTAAVLAGC
jgi:RHS repeat-associated protein